MRGEVDKYTWRDLGSSFLPGELTAAFLWAQLEKAEQITIKRLKIWNRYHKDLKKLEESGKLRRPAVPENCKHNAHIYYILLNSFQQREETLRKLLRKGIKALIHYVPLHPSPAGKQYGRLFAKAPVTKNISERILRLPLFIGLTSREQKTITELLA